MIGRARTALTLALFGIIVSPFVALTYGVALGIGISAAFAAVGIALFPEPAQRA